MKPIQFLLLVAVLLGHAALEAADLPAPGSTNSPPSAPPPTEPAAGSNAAPNTLAAPGAARRDIRFQFDGIPYSDVVNRFAQMAGKPLLSDTNISGTLTYDDPNAYTYIEALDTLNLMLAMKGVMLLEDGNNLRLVPFKQLPSMPIRILRGSDSTGDVRPGEIVTVVLQINNLDAKEVADATLPLLSTAGSVAPLSRGRGVIITDRLANIQRVRTLLATIGPDESADRQMKTYTLLHASGAIVSDLLNRTFGVATAPRKTTFNPNTKAMEILPADPNDYITSVYDEASRTMVLFGPPDRIALAEELINKFEDKDCSGGDVRIYYPQSIKAEDLAGMIRQAIPGVAAPNESSTSSSTKARVIADPSQNRLIVAAPIPAQLDQIEQLITRVDRGVQGAGGAPSGLLVPLRSQTVELTRIYRPRSTDATNVAAILRQALTRKSSSGQLVTTASVSSDTGSKSVVVTGSPSDIQTASDIVSELETGTSQPTPLQTRFIDAGSPEEAKRILPLVEQLYLNQTADGLAGSVAHAKIMADPESGRLIVTATREHLERIEAIVQQLRLDRPQTLARHLKVISLKNTRTDTALPNIQSLVSERMSDRRFATLPKPSLVADAPNNRLLVTATDEQLKEIDEVVRVVDIAPVRAERELEVIPLQVRQASEVIPLVSQLTAQLAAPGEPAPTLMADPAGKQIIVLAAAKDHARIRELVKQFDASPATAAPRQFQGVELYNRNATELTPLVQQLYQEQIRGQPEPAGGAATLIPETKSNRVMVSGSDKEIARVEAIIRQLDPARNASATNETRVVRLKTANAAELSGLVDKTVNARSQQVQVLMDARSNSLVVTGDHAAVEAAALMIQQLDTPADAAPREMRVIDLKSADAATVAPILSSLYSEMIKSQRGADFIPAAKIVPDTAANRLIVTGSHSEIDQVASLLQPLDNAPDQASGARVFKLATVDAGMMATVVSNAMLRFDTRGRAIPRVTVTADEKSNSLIVAGPRADLQEAESVIAKLDGESGGKERSLRVFEVKGDPDALAALIQSVFAAENPGRNMTNVLSVTPEPGGKRLFVLASAALMPQVETVINTLEEKSGLERRELHSIDLTNTAASTLLPRIRQIYAEQAQGKGSKAASVYADASGARILVQGTAEQAAAVRQIVETIGTQSRPAREIKTFDLGGAAEVQRLLPLVQQLYLDQWKDKKDVDPPDAQFVADPRSGRLIVTGKPDHLKQIEVLLQQLGAGKARPSSRETRILDLATASAVDLAATVRPLYLEEAKGRLGNQTPDTLITPDAGGNRLILVGEKEELDAVEETVRKLDKVSAQSGSTRVFKLKSADPEMVAGILGTALVRYDANGRPQKRVSVVPDAKTRAIIATGDPKDLQSASAIIEQLDSSLGAEPGRTMRVIPAKERGVSEFGAKVRQVYEDQAKNRSELGTTEPLILDDPASNQLILAGTEKQLDAIGEIALMLQKSGDAGGRQARVFPLEHASAASLVKMLSQVYAKEIATTEPSERVVVTVGGNDHSLMVEAPPATLARVEELVKSLEQPGPDGPNVVQTVHLSKGRAEALAEAVNRAITNKTGGPVTGRVGVTAVPGSNSLLINGPTNAVREVMRIVHDLDQESANPGNLEIHVYKLENGVARQISAVIQQLLRAVTENLRQTGAPGEDGRTPEATVTVDERSNSLIVSGLPAHFKVMEGILPTLDKAPERSDRDVQFVWLRKAKASEVASQLDELFRDRPRSERPVIEPDTQGNSLTIIAKRGDIVQIQDLVSRLDEQGKTSSSLQVRVRPLDNVSAEQMAKMLEHIYPQMSGTPVRVSDKVAPVTEQKPGATAPAPEVVVAVDKAANALILSGPAQELDNVDRLINDLSQNFSENESEFRIFPLKDADPVIVARTLTELLRQEVPLRQAGEPARAVSPVKPRFNVVPESRTRSVIVRARPTDFTLLESLIKQLDTVGQTAQLAFRVVPLTNAPPDKVLPLVQQMVAQLGATRPGESVTVGVDGRSRGLVVIARENMADQVEKMIRGLDTPSANPEAEVRIVSLKKANAAQLAAVLENMLKPDAQGGATARARELQEQVTRLKILNDDGQAVILDLTQPIKISPDPAAGAGGGNRLLLMSTPDNLRALAAVVELMDSVPVLEGVEVRFVRLDHANATAVSQTLETIFTQGRQLAVGPGGPGAEPAGQGKALVHPLNVAVDARRNTIILSGREESVDLAMRIIQNMDRDLDGFVTDVRLIRLKYASASRLLPLLQSVFADGPSVPGTEGLSTHVSRLRTLKEGDRAKTNQTLKVRAALTIQADDQSNILIVAARADDLPLIQDVIDQLDIPTAAGLDTVRLYQLEHADPAAVQKILTDLYNGPRGAALRNEEKPNFSVDARTGTLIVAGNPPAFDLIEALLKRLDQKLPFELRDFMLIPLEHSDAGVAAATLQKVMDARVTQRATLNQGQADALKIIIIADQRSNSLLVGGNREGLELVETLAKQLDQANPALSGQVRLIALQYADARVIAATMSALFEQRYAAVRATDAQRNKPILLADPRSNSLLVAASQEDNRALDELLQRLDRKQDNPALTLTVLPLKHNDSAKIATTIESIFAARLRAESAPGQAALPSEQIKIEPDPLNNAIVVSASKENLELIQGLVQKLDQEPSVADGVFETFTLQFADAQRVASLLKSLVDQGLYRPGRPAGATAKAGSSRDILSISVDPPSNTLIVSASPENLAVVRDVVRRIDSKDLAATADVRLYTLKHARATTLAATLQEFFQAKKTADSAGVSGGLRLVPATAIADDRMNSILVTGGKDAFDLVDRLLPQLDGEDQFARLNFRVFPLKRATALKLQATLQPIFANRPPRVKGEPVQPVTIIADQWVNALLVGASVEDLGAVASLVERLDADPGQTGLAIHVFPLAKADARSVATTVQGLFRENQPTQAVPLTVAADERINAIVVSCGETDAQHIAELVKKLDTEQVSKISEIKVFPLQYARADALALILNSALNTKPPTLNQQQSPNAQSLLQFATLGADGRQLITAALKEAVLVTSDPRMNSLIVSGPVDYMGLIGQIIQRLDSSSPQQAKIKVFTLRNANARQMGQLLTQLFRMSPNPASPGANSGGIVGTERSVQYTLVRSLDQDDQDSPDVPVASATVGTAEQNALTVTIDPRTNSLLVGGSDRYVNLVSQIIESLDSSAARERTSEVIRMKNSQALDVATAIRAFLDQERQRAVQALGVDATAASQRMFDEEEVAITPEPVSNTLLLSANQRYFEQIRSMINELDKAQPQVLIQVFLAEVTLNDQTDLGVEWSVTGKKGGETYSMGSSLGVANQLQSLGGFSAAASGTDLNFLIRALKTVGKLTVLSRPQIVTSDNKPATINIGQRVPLVDQSRLDVNNNLTTSYTYQDIGVSLTVTPKISPDGFVKMSIGITNSDISATSVQINTSSSVPIIDQRFANTTVTARSGQTIVIGGLISTSDSKNIKKLPVLGDVPYLGALFRTSSIIRTRSELLVLLTPQVLNNAQIPAPLLDPEKVTHEQLDKSILREETDRDELQKRLLDPLFPTYQPPSRIIPNSTTNLPR
jgi:type II secretion system protein D